MKYLGIFNQVTSLLGKFIVSYVPVCREKEYYIACACGELYVPPTAYVRLYGLALQTTFLGGMFAHQYIVHVLKC